MTIAGDDTPPRGITAGDDTPPRAGGEDDGTRPTKRRKWDVEVKEEDKDDRQGVVRQGIDGRCTQEEEV